jgi:pSer/pThr/pTyr-binding forkhead associated (FHA) protein
MTDDAARPQPAARSTADVQALIAAERGGQPFLTGRGEDGRQLIVVLPRDRWRLTVGRKPESDIALGWDVEVSRAHALLELVGDQWTLVDDGLSSNGSYVNGQRVVGRQRLRQGDRLCFGSTQLLFRDPGPPNPPESEATRRDVRSTAMALTPTQRKVLVALCRPLNDATSALPATNKQIADEVFLSVDAVKAQLRLLFDRFGLAELAQNEKRVRLAQAAFASGSVTPRDF